MPYAAYDMRSIRLEMSTNLKTKQELIQNITRVARPLLYIRHIFFVDFPKHGFREPMYINIARDPVDLFISNYYYLRFGFQSAKNTTNAQNWKRDMSDERREMSIGKSSNSKCQI